MLCRVSTYLHMDTNDAQALPRKPNATVIMLDYRECTEPWIERRSQTPWWQPLYAWTYFVRQRERQTGRDVNKITLEDVNSDVITAMRYEQTVSSTPNVYFLLMWINVAFKSRKCIQFCILMH